MPIKYTLGDTLRELEMSNNKLAVESKIRPATIGDITSGLSKSLSIRTITAILDELNRVGNRDYGIEDIIKYEKNATID